MSLSIYHNPRCSKSRETLALLEQRGLEPEVIKYLETPPDADHIRRLLSLLNMSSARQLMRTKEAIYSELNISNEQDEQTLIAAIVAHPTLLERPIVVNGEQAALGRPPENVLDIL
ncbi:arsenate reductase (glutaredoxin) [Oceanisphaera avium]|uniref:Arsenate reductase n=1 Tax=Oceanisphaera avium TaxID=1903694 RepID=A0A1Y0D1F4_9GAMM|nr:arsenate reductase (glutaredoxin) [Oceanisphaera avium]ART81026.1 arsenate reductase (glutaredoxin) [Oceanisphaera avium]